MSNIDLEKLRAGLNASYMGNKPAAALLKPHGYTLDHELSGQRAKVYVDNQTGQPHIAYRGTQNKHDVVTDIKAFLGIGGKRLTHTKKVAKQVELKYGRPAHALGHSLGGWLSENSGVHGKIITYNKLANGQTKKNEQQTDIRTSNDVASILSAKKTARKGITLKGKKNDAIVTHGTRFLKSENVIDKPGVMKASRIIG